MTYEDWLNAREAERARNRYSNVAREMNPTEARYRSAGTRFAVLRWLLIVGIGLMVVFLGYDAWAFVIVEDAREGALTIAQAETYDTIGLVISLALLAVGLTIIVALLAWLSRSVDNTPALAGRRPIISPRMSIVWWFVPLANFIQPFRIVRDLRENMARGPVRAGAVLLWWLVVLATTFVGLYASSVAIVTLDDLATYATASIVTDLIQIANFALTLWLFGEIQRDADVLAATRDTDAAPGLAPAEAS